MKCISGTGSSQEVGQTEMVSTINTLSVKMMMTEVDATRRGHGTSNEDFGRTVANSI